MFAGAPLSGNGFSSHGAGAWQHQHQQAPMPPSTNWNGNYSHASQPMMGSSLYPTASSWQQQHRPSPPLSHWQQQPPPFSSSARPSTASLPLATRPSDPYASNGVWTPAVSGPSLYPVPPQPAMNGSLSARGGTPSMFGQQHRPQTSLYPQPPSASPSPCAPQPPPVPSPYARSDTALPSHSSSALAGSVSARAAYASVSAVNGFTPLSHPTPPAALVFMEKREASALLSPYGAAHADRDEAKSLADAPAPPVSLLLNPPPRLNFHRTGGRSYMSRTLDPMGMFHATDGPLGSRRIHAFRSTIDMATSEGRDGWVPARGAHPDALKYSTRTHARRVAAQQQRAYSARLHRQHGTGHEPPLPTPQPLPSLAAARDAVLAYFASPPCMLFSESSNVVAVSDADLDRLIRVCEAGASSATGKETLALLSDLDIEQQRFVSFEALLDEAKQRSGLVATNDDEARPATPTFLTDEQAAADGASASSPVRGPSAEEKLAASPYGFSVRSSPQGSTAATEGTPRSLALTSPQAIARHRARFASAREAWMERRARAEARASRERQRVVEERAAMRAEKLAQEEAAEAELAREKAEKARKAALAARKQREDEAERQLAERSARLQREEAEKAAIRAEKAKREEAHRRRDADMKRILAEHKAKTKGKRKDAPAATEQGSGAGAAASGTEAQPSSPSPPPAREGAPSHHFSDEMQSRASAEHAPPSPSSSSAQDSAFAPAPAAATAAAALGSGRFTLVTGSGDDEGEFVEASQEHGREEVSSTPSPRPAEMGAAKEDADAGVDAAPTQPPLTKAEEQEDAPPPAQSRPQSAASTKPSSSLNAVVSTSEAAAAASSPASPAAAAGASASATSATASSVKCDQCFSALAFVRCTQCDEHLCGACDEEVHAVGSSMARHTRKPVGEETAPPDSRVLGGEAEGTGEKDSAVPAAATPVEATAAATPPSPAPAAVPATEELLATPLASEDAASLASSAPSADEASVAVPTPEEAAAAAAEPASAPSDVAALKEVAAVAAVDKAESAPEAVADDAAAELEAAPAADATAPTEAAAALEAVASTEPPEQPAAPLAEVDASTPPAAAVAGAEVAAPTADGAGPSSEPAADDNKEDTPQLPPLPTDKDDAPEKDTKGSSDNGSGGAEPQAAPQADAVPVPQEQEPPREAGAEAPPVPQEQEQEQEQQKAANAAVGSSDSSNSAAASAPVADEPNAAGATAAAAGGAASRRNSMSLGDLGGLDEDLDSL